MEFEANGSGAFENSFISMVLFGRHCCEPQSSEGRGATAACPSQSSRKGAGQQQSKFSLT